ncbi:MAG: hypothetical protein HOM25_10100 [Rhodospirillaceae bacterium]|jgi:hypothetical protein|nr:hypothetical protein [Rhodospirillaceae bacterium]
MADVAGVSTFTTTGVQGLAAPVEEPDALDEDRAAEERAAVQLETDGATGDPTGNPQTASAVVQVGDTPSNNQTGPESQTSAATATTATQPQDRVVLSAEATAATETEPGENTVLATAENGTGNTNGANQNGATQALGQIIDIFV